MIFMDTTVSMIYLKEYSSPVSMIFIIEVYFKNTQKEYSNLTSMILMDTSILKKYTKDIQELNIFGIYYGNQLQARSRAYLSRGINK